MHVEFGLAHPGLFAILSSEPNLHSPSVAAEDDILRRKIRNIALSGRLQVSEDRAAALLQSMCIGTVLTLLGEPEERRDAGLSVAAREAVLATITGDAIATLDSKPSGAAAALRASLDKTAVLTAGEMHLLKELLDRIADGDY